ncbi:MAG: tetratricopeptide repeat protein [Vicinamibacterales bacterium]
MATAPSPPASQHTPLAGETVVFAGRMLALERREARALGEQLGGVVVDDVTAAVTVLVLGSAPPGGRPGERGEHGAKLARAKELNESRPGRVRILDEDAFCQLAGITTPSELRRSFQPECDLLERYGHLRPDQLRYLEKWGLVRPAHRAHGHTFYAFADVAVIRQADAELAAGTPFRAVVRNLLVSRSGQLALDFRIEAQPAKVLQLVRPDPPPLARLLEPHPDAPHSSAEQYFVTASVLDDGDPAHQAEAAAAYRRAIEADPSLVPAIINLANIHYASDHIPEAQALYERAVTLDPDVFEAHFNLGNIFHDLGLLAEAQACYRTALKLNAAYADAHFYLAVVLEKSGQSQEARHFWRSYQRLAPNGEWVSLAKEFAD